MSRHGATMMGRRGSKAINLLAEGDSLTSGLQTSGVSYATLYRDNYSPAQFDNAAVSGSYAANVSSRGSTDDAYLSGTLPNIYTVLLGANDLQAVSAASFLSDLATLCDARRTAGWIVVVCTVLPYTGTGFNAKRATVNDAFRASWLGVHCDYLVDFDTTIMGLDATASDTSYYGDNLHPTLTGQAILATPYAAVINRIPYVIAPTFSPVAGTYTGTQSVSIACATSGTSIYYTLDGSTPTTGSTLYTGAVSVSASETIKAIAVKSSYGDSDLVTAGYVIIPPTFMAATGGTITTDGDYKVHTFPTVGSDTFTVTTAGYARRLLVGGGGGGGSYAAGGGGAGGVLDNVAYDHYLAIGVYAVEVGNKGSGSPDTSTAPTAGGDSSFDGDTAVGGGRSASSSPGVAATGGGSGGGGSNNSTAGGSGTSGQGNAGGTGTASNNCGGGGGGAGAAGSNANSPTFNAGGHGGDGIASDITGSSVYYGGGGSGAGPSVQGTGGLGGGGNGGDNSGHAATAGTNGLGGGGGGGFLNPGADGGTGVVIIRYKFQ